MIRVNTHLVAGVDEVGRGPLAGPVVAAAVILDPQQPISGLTDSKKLTERKRQVLAACIKERALSWAIGAANVVEIDRINIFHASLLAMQRAIYALNITPEHILVDGKFCPKSNIPSQAIIKGDLTEPAISAASIIAKVARDELMINFDDIYPQYGFAGHKGYPTKAHVAALQQHGVSIIHRMSFQPVKRAYQSQYSHDFE